MRLVVGDWRGLLVILITAIIIGTFIGFGLSGYWWGWLCGLMLFPGAIVMLMFHNALIALDDE